MSPSESTPAPTAVQERFAEGDEHTVIDLKQKMVWLKQDTYQMTGKWLNWVQSRDYAKELNQSHFAGYNDWRLPTLNEFKQIWDPKRPIASKDGEPIGLPVVFAGGGSYYLWTGNERNLDHAWYFGLGQREDYFNLKDLGDLDQGVKLVRKHQ